jgi:uncharacterized protein (DUF952 family)
VTFIYHIAAAADWARALRDGQYTMSTRGLPLAEQGYIHAATAEQVPLVADAFYRDVPDLLLLVIDTERLGPELRYEPVPGQASPYPHIYGPLNLTAVTEIRPFDPEAPPPMKRVRGRGGGSRAGTGAGSPPPSPARPCG